MFAPLMCRSSISLDDWYSQGEKLSALDLATNPMAWIAGGSEQRGARTPRRCGEPGSAPVIVLTVRLVPSLSSPRASRKHHATAMKMATGLISVNWTV